MRASDRDHETERASDREHESERTSDREHGSTRASHREHESERAREACNTGPLTSAVYLDLWGTCRCLVASR